MERDMDNKKGNRLKNITRILIAICLLGVLFFLSSMNGRSSNQMTMKLANFVQSHFMSGFEGDYLRIVRQGDTFTQFYSADKKNWQAVGNPQHIPMGKTTYVGLVVSSHSEKKLCQAEFDSVELHSDSGIPTDSWEDTDIGKLNLSGEAESKGDLFALRGGGWQDWNKSDQYHFVYWKLDGDGSITARLRSVEATDDWALAGIMIRESLNAADKFDGIVITPRGAISPQSRTGTEIHMEWKNTHKSNTNYKVRKTLHFTGYLILFLVFFWALQFIRIGKGKIILISTFLCAAIASLDEFNQSFSGGREPRVADVLIDTSGAALAALILLLITLIRRKQVKV